MLVSSLLSGPFEGYLYLSSGYWSKIKKSSNHKYIPVQIPSLSHMSNMNVTCIRGLIGVCSSLEHCKVRRKLWFKPSSYCIKAGQRMFLKLVKEKCFSQHVYCDLNARANTLPPLQSLSFRCCDNDQWINSHLRIISSCFHQSRINNILNSRYCHWCLSNICCQYHLNTTWKN